MFPRNLTSRLLWILLLLLLLPSNLLAAEPGNESPASSPESTQTPEATAPESELPSGVRAPLPTLEQADDNHLRNWIDERLAEGLKKQGLLPAPLASDSIFMRRVYLDLVGRIPRAAEVRTFLADPSPQKREQLIDELLASRDFIDYESLRWGDTLRIKSEFPINLWPQGAAVYHRWVRNAIRTNMPYDEFARRLLTGGGSNFRDPPSNFYRAVAERDADSIAEAVALTFLGERTGPWPEEKRKQLATFFSRVAYKSTAEWKEEIVYWDRTPLESNELVFPDGTRMVLPEGKDPRAAFAEWLTSKENMPFARCGVNRIWSHLFGYGLVHEPDDFRADNPPSQPELLEALAHEFIVSKYDLKNLYRVILCSRTYQQSSIPMKPDDRAERLFASYPVRRLDAEALQDIIQQIFGISVTYQSEIPEPYTFVPDGRRTIKLGDASVTSPFLEMFGRSSRDSGMLSDRIDKINESQRMFFLNSTEINNWVAQFVRNTSLADGKRQPKRIADEIWLTFFSRFPTEAEYDIVEKSIADRKNRLAEVVQDIVWTLLNSKEFLCRH